jgi:hypothetical protein
MMSGMGDFKDDIDWSVYKDQQIPSAQGNKQVADTQQDSYHQDIQLGRQSSESKSPKSIHETLSGLLASGPKAMAGGIMKGLLDLGQGHGSKVASDVIPTADQFLPVGSGAAKGAEVAEAGWKYMHPEKAAEKFRSALGEGTSKENIENLSKRAQLAKQSTKQEALIPKEKLYEQEGKSDVYKVNPNELPEGNLPKMAHMIDPEAKFSESQSASLSKALKEYRKTGNVESFMDKSEDIFNIPELTDKAASKIEDALSLPTKRDSSYFGDKEVTDVYSKKGKLMELHNAYEDKPILANYDKLQSALKKELRSMEERAKVSDSAQPKVDQLKSNISNLNSDKESFMQTLPDTMKDLENQFRNKYQQYAKTYEKGNKETGASLTLRRLAEGRHDLVNDQAVVKLFANPTAADKKAILDMGEGAARNALYAAVQKVPENDAAGLANTILDLKRTKGFDKVVTSQMEDWANNMLKHVNRVNNIRKAAGMAGGAMAGGAVFGPFGAVAGASLPYVAKALPHVGKYLGKYLKK